MCSECKREKSIDLINGDRCCSYCDRFRSEAEARFVLAMPTKSQRRLYLDGDPMNPRKMSVRKMRGDTATKALEVLALKIWRKKNEG